MVSKYDDQTLKCSKSYKVKRAKKKMETGKFETTNYQIQGAKPTFNNIA